MNLKLTALILLVLIGLLCVVTYVSYHPPKKKTPALKLVFSKAPARIKTLTLTRPKAAKSNPPLAFRRTGGKWRLTSPVSALARDRVDSLVRGVAHLKWRYRVAVESAGAHSLAAAGLSPAKALFTLHDSRGHVYRLAVGRRNSGGRRYVRPVGVKSRYIYVVSNSWFKSFQHPAAHFRNLNLADFHIHNIASISVRGMAHGHAANFTIIPRASGWVFTRPFPAPVNTGGIQDWLSDIQLLAAAHFSTASEKSAGLKTGPLRITIRFKPVAAPGPVVKAKPVHPSVAPPLVIRFGDFSDLTRKRIYLYSSQNPGLAVIPVGTFTPLNRTLADLRDKALTRDSLNTADRISLRTAGAALQLIHTGAQWRIVPAGSKAAPLPARAAAVSKLLKAVAALRAKSFIDGKINRAGLGLVNPAHKLVISLVGRAHPLIIQWGAIGKKSVVPVGISTWPSVYNVPAKALRSLPGAAVAAFRSRSIADIAPARILSLHLPPNGTFPGAVLRQIHGKWSIARGTVAFTPVKTSVVQPLLAALHPLAAKKWYRLKDSSAAMHWTHLPYELYVTIHESPAARAKARPAPGAKAVASKWILQMIRRTVPSPLKTAGKTAAKPLQRWYAWFGTQNAAPNASAFEPHAALIAAIRALMQPAPAAKPVVKTVK